MLVKNANKKLFCELSYRSENNAGSAASTQLWSALDWSDHFDDRRLGTFRGPSVLHLCSDGFNPRYRHYVHRANAPEALFWLGGRRVCGPLESQIYDGDR